LDQNIIYQQIPEETSPDQLNAEQTRTAFINPRNEIQLKQRNPRNENLVSKEVLCIYVYIIGRSADVKI
jgi:hypothetical protein